MTWRGPLTVAPPGTQVQIGRVAEVPCAMFWQFAIGGHLERVPDLRVLQV